MKITKPLKSSKNQQGAILVMALFMLLLMTIVGISSMRNTSLEETMAGNLRESNISLQAAEAALRAGEKVVTDKLVSNSLETLDDNPETGTYRGFTGLSNNPTYRISLIALQRTSTAAGEPTAGNEGAIVREEATGYGVSKNSNASSTSTTNLRSTFQSIED